MAFQILTTTAASITELKRDPMGTFNAGDGAPVAILNRNEPAFYLRKNAVSRMATGFASLTIVERCVYPPKSRRVFCRASARWVRAHGIMRIWLAIKLTTAPASIRSRRCVLPPWQKGILNIQIWWKSKKSKPPAPGRFYAPGAPRFANTTTFKTLFG